MNINKLTLMGRLTADPELKMSNSGVPVVRFTVAVNRKQQKDKENKTDFLNCVAFYKTADFVAQYFTKGALIIVFGSVQVENYQDKEGKNRTSTSVVVDEVQFGETKSQAKKSSPNIEKDVVTSDDTTLFEEVDGFDEEPLPF